MASDIPLDAWDCHVHCFDPKHHPFKSTRVYTPEAAPLSSLNENVLTNRVMIVQATIEDGPVGLLEHLAEAKRINSDRLFRGTVFADPEPARNLSNVSAADFEHWHRLGVRSVRIHGSYGGSGDSSAWVRDQFCHAARLYPVNRLGWSISAQLPLSAWASLSKTLYQDDVLSEVNIIADHNGSARPEDIGTANMDAFLDLLSSGKLYVKVGAFHRRAPDNISRMLPVVRLFVNRAPKAVLWGSDWPHVDTSKGFDKPSPPLQGVDDKSELQMTRACLSDEEWYDMLVTNPSKLFN